MPYKILIDPGHAPGNTNKGATRYYEHEGMWKLSNYLKAALERCGSEFSPLAKTALESSIEPFDDSKTRCRTLHPVPLSVSLTRTENKNPSLSERGQTAKGFDLFISEHSNAANGTARGVEVFYSVQVSSDKTFAEALSKSVSGLMNNPDRGAKTRASTNSAAADYYTVMNSARKAGCPHVFIVENGFHDNPVDEGFLLKAENLKAVAEAQAKVICEFFGVSYVQTPPIGTPVLAPPSADAAQARAWRSQAHNWAKSKNATDTFVFLAAKYFNYAPDHGGVNPVLAYCQAALETGYGRFKGVLDESYHNPCGMKTGAGGGCDDPNAHQRFTCWGEGVKAHLDHLALYAGAAGYPAAKTYDPRHFPYLLGTGRTVEDMAKSWCPSNDGYAAAILRLMGEVAAMPVDMNEGDREVVDETKIKIDGKVYTVKRIFKDGRNYVQLDSLKQAGISVAWDAAGNMPVLSFPK